MASKRVTVELGADLVDAARDVARRTGVAEDDLYDRALRDVLSRDYAQLMEEIEGHQRRLGESLSDDQAMDLAQEELRATRARPSR